MATISFSMYHKCVFNFLRNCLLFSKEIVPFCMPTSDVALHLCKYLLWSVLIFCHSNRCLEVSHFGVNLHFPNSQRCQASFHVIIVHPYIFFGNCLFNYCACLGKKIVFLLLSFEGSLWIQVIFFYLVIWLFFSLTGCKKNKSLLF